MQEVLYTISNGLYVIGAGQTPHFAGALVDSVTQISATPTLIMISMMNTSHTLSVINQTQEFSLSVLSKDTSPSVVANFGFQTGKNIDKWENTEYEIKDNLPYIPNSVSQIKFKLVDTISYPNNTLLIAEPVKYYEFNSKSPLTYQYYRKHLKPLCQKAFGLHSSCNMNTSPKETSLNKKPHKKLWVCTICQYEYDGTIPFEELDSSWRCPYCGVTKDMFKQI